MEVIYQLLAELVPHLFPPFSHHLGEDVQCPSLEPKGRWEKAIAPVTTVAIIARLGAVVARRQQLE